MVNPFPDAFKELNLTQLEIYAEEWAVNFSVEFDRIVLFRFLNPKKALHEYVMQGPIPGRYFILFELKWSTLNASSSFREMIRATAKTAFNEMIQATAKEAGILLGDLLLPECVTKFELWRNDILERYERLLYATGQTTEGSYLTIHEEIERYQKILIGDNFHRVYKNKSDYIQDDWKFRVKDPNEDVPLGVKEEDGYFWVLYDSNKALLDQVKNDVSPLNIFRETPPSWEIVYNNRTPLRGLKGKGFRYIHFLVKHPKKLYNIDWESSVKI